ncbi:MAG TPA: SIMPL domain-containing protein [Candidatus Eremiobacteraceae bacterium]|nr:SIMPL domain-containing protein [Candidatus Eremiobacteraceae bacterium]
MKRQTLLALATAIVLGASMTPALADAAKAPTITVSGSGSVTYAPDTAQISLGVRAQSPSATAAASMVNGRAGSVIAALRKQGIADADITTSDYTIQYQMPDNSDMQPNASMSVAPKRPAQGYYVATETIDVKAPISKAGPVLDAGLAAGADETNGISFDTSQRTKLYREALSRAVADARAQAQILAKAAGVSIAGIQSISVGGGPSPIEPMVRMAAAAAQAAVMGGTGTVDASVQIVFRIK